MSMGMFERVSVINVIVYSLLGQLRLQVDQCVAYNDIIGHEYRYIGRNYQAL
mgnify:FL=1